MRQLRSITEPRAGREAKMTTQERCVILGGMRTAIGDFGGALKDVAPTDLGAHVINAVIKKVGVLPEDIEQVVLGNVVHTAPEDMYISRVCAVKAGIPVSSPALTVNRLCGSGIQAIVSAAQSILLGDQNVAVAGGVESMSRSGYLLPSVRWGQKMGNAELIDMLTMGLTDPFGNGHMGVTAENVASEYNISRKTQDEYAFESHKRAATAIDKGYFHDQIAPYTVKRKREDYEFKVDEHVRANIAYSDMEKLRPVFKKDGTVTAGNASGMNDGAGALLLMSESEAGKRDLAPLARVVSYGFSGVEPSLMGIGPVGAVREALKKAELTADDMDVVESNEAFASQACAVSSLLNLDPEKVNPNGGAIAFGHPIGASGAIITIKLLHELTRIRGRYGLATMCIGGGQGIALIIERV